MSAYMRIENSAVSGSKTRLARLPCLIWINRNTFRHCWPVAAAVAAMIATVCLGEQSRGGSHLTLMASSSAGQIRVQPQLRATSHRVERRLDYVTVSGMTANITQKPLKNVEALVEFFDKRGVLLKSESALIELPTLRAGEESPFVVQTRDMVDLAAYRVRFRELLGASIPSTDN